MPKLSIMEGKDFWKLAQGFSMYKAKVEKMFKETYEDFDAIKKRARAVHLDEMEFSLQDAIAYSVPKEVILHPDLAPHFPYWPIYSYTAEGMVKREIARIKVV